MRIAIPLLLASVLLLPALAGNDPFNGKWKADPAKSKFRVDSPRKETMTIEADDKTLSMDREGVDTAGQAFALAIRAGFGGSIFGVIDSPRFDSVKCWRTNDRTITIQLFQHGAAVEWLTAEVSKDGRTLKLTTTSTDAKGKEDKTTIAFEQGAG